MRNPFLERYLALVAVTERPNVISAMVSRRGRPDLAGKDILRKVKAPRLFLVGGNDEESPKTVSNN